MEEEKDNKGRLALERNLQKAFKAIQSFSGAVQTVTAETLPIVRTVATFLEQSEFCASADCSVLPFAAQFPDLKGRLVCKIREEMAEKVGELEIMIEVLKEKQEVTRKYCETSWSLVHKYSSVLDAATVCADSPTCFSLADMLEWLETVDTLLHQQYWSKVHLLESVMSGEGVQSDNLVLQWTDQDDVLTNTIKDYLTRVELFVGEKR
ncbi:AFG2-interacting ribosome maturation factor-like [Babylonia areolata]|uniref:AFG2-interacting ribosome maturation factor-like n=1 Tax=Babylonia areolata TaxID=304850 RepID=UPI003FD2F5C4